MPVEPQILPRVCSIHHVGSPLYARVITQENQLDLPASEYLVGRECFGNTYRGTLRPWSRGEMWGADRAGPQSTRAEVTQTGPPDATGFGRLPPPPCHPGQLPHRPEDHVRGLLRGNHSTGLGSEAQPSRRFSARPTSVGASLASSFGGLLNLEPLFFAPPRGTSSGGTSDALQRRSRARSRADVGVHSGWRESSDDGKGRTRRCTGSSTWARRQHV